MKTSELFATLETLKSSQTAERKKLTDLISAKLYRRFDDWTALQKAIVNLDSATMYAWNSYGEIDRWFRFGGLADVEENEREYLEAYLSDKHCIRVDFDNDLLITSEGPSIIINTGYRDRDAGVFDQDSGKQILSVDDYRDEEGGIDEAKRNALIEDYMEKTGHFPGVFIDDGHGNLSCVNTQPKAK